MFVDSCDDCSKIEGRDCQKPKGGLEVKKRNYPRIVILLLLVVGAMAMAVSCSTQKRKLLRRGKDGPTQYARLKVVQQKYDELNKKYDELKSELRAFKEEQQKRHAQREVDTNQFGEKSSDPATILPAENENQGLTLKGDSLITDIDGLSKRDIMAEAPTALPLEDGLDGDEAKRLELESFQLQKARSVIERGRYQIGMNLLQDLQKSKHRQIQVRAQFLIGETLFLQGEFELARQAYQEVVQKNAFSGLVIKTLQRLITCTEHLKMKKQKEQYSSMLHDFFGKGKQ